MSFRIHDSVRESLKGKSPAVKLVWGVIQEADRPLTTGDISSRGQLPQRTVAKAVSQLDDAGLLSEVPTADGRVPAYCPSMNNTSE